MTSTGPALDALRARVAASGLTGEAVGQLTPVVSGLWLEALGPVKQLLKRFFSDAPWTDDDDEALADAIGAAGGDAADGRHELEPGLTFVWTWESGRFRLRLGSDEPEGDERDCLPPASNSNDTDADLEVLFDGGCRSSGAPSSGVARTVRRRA